MDIVYKLSELFSVDESNLLPSEVDLIALVSIGSTKTDLSKGAIETINRTLNLLEKYENKPKVVYGSFAGNSRRVTIEEDWKKKIFGENGYYAGKVWSTISECLAFKKAFPAAKCVIFVTEAAHSRRAKVVWNCLWPEAKIYIISVPLEKAIDRKSYMATYHNPWKALILQVGPLPIYKIAAFLGQRVLKSLGGIHQPTLNT